jgi:hypothetical protein
LPAVLDFRLKREISHPGSLQKLNENCLVIQHQILITWEQGSKKPLWVERELILCVSELILSSGQLHDATKNLLSQFTNCGSKNAKVEVWSKLNLPGSHTCFSECCRLILTIRIGFENVGQSHVFGLLNSLVDCAFTRANCFSML